MAVDIPLSRHSLWTQSRSYGCILPGDRPSHGWKRISPCKWNQPQLAFLYSATTPDERNHNHCQSKAEIANAESSHCAQNTIQEGRGTIDVCKWCFLHELPMHSILTFVFVYVDIRSQRASGWTLLSTIWNCMYCGNLLNRLVSYYGSAIIVPLLTDQV